MKEVFSMKLAKPLVWKSGLVALGLLSIVSLQSVGAQTTTTTPATGGSVTTPANGTNGGNGNNANNGNDSGGYGPGDNGGNWHVGRGGMKGGRFGGRHGGMRGNIRVGQFGANAMIGGVSAQSIADYLGLTTEQLKADLDAGQSLAQIAVAQGKTSDDLRAFMIQQSTTAIDAALNRTTTPKANGNGNGTAGNGVGATTPSASATPAV
jgi:hypothetical protein